MTASDDGAGVVSAAKSCGWSADDNPEFRRDSPVVTSSAAGAADSGAVKARAGGAAPGADANDAWLRASGASFGSAPDRLEANGRNDGSEG